MGERESYRSVAVLFYIICSLLSFGSPNSAEAISFTNISGPIGSCNTGTPPGFCQDVGIDYSALTGNLVVSTNFGVPGIDLANVDRFTGIHSTVNNAPSNANDELKVATARVAGPACSGQSFPVGTIFTGTGQSGVVIIIPPTGLPITLHLQGTSLTQPGTVTENSVLRGGFYQDRFCAAGGDLFVVSGSGHPTDNVGGNVWRVHPDGSGDYTITHIVTIPNTAGAANTRGHLEGVVVVPDDQATYGSPAAGGWAGMIVTGDEDRIEDPSTASIVNGPHARIYAINPNTGVYKTFGAAGETGVDFTIVGPMPNPEDFDFIGGPDELSDFYGVAYNNNGSDKSGTTKGTILSAPFSAFNHPAPVNPSSRIAGDILVTQEYPQTPGVHSQISTLSCVDAGQNSGLYQFHWNAATSKFESTQLIRTGTSPMLCQWEHVTFAPTSGIKIDKLPDGNSFGLSDQISFTIKVTSTGPGTATNVVMTDPLPTPGNLGNWQLDGNVSSTGLIAPAPTNASCTIGSIPDPANFLRCNLGNMGAGATFTVTVKTTKASGADMTACTTNKGEVDNTATVTADGGLKDQNPGFWLCAPPSGKAKIEITPNATNDVGQSHTFTVTLSKDIGSGFVPAANEHVDVTLTDSNGATHTGPTGTCTNAGANTNASGQCTITFSSPTAGKVTGHATSTLNISGLIITVATNGVAPNSGDAVKTFVDANIQITPDGTNEVGKSHTFTAHVNVNAGDGNGFVNAPNGTQISLSIDSGPGGFTTTNPCTVSGGTGSCTVALSSPTPGVTKVSAHVTLQVSGILVHRDTDGKGANSGLAVKTWVDANIQITPATALNPVSTNHTLTGHVNVNPGTGFVNASNGTVINFSLTNLGGATATFVGPNSCATSGGTGSCTVIISSPTGGSTTIKAKTDVTVGGQSLHRETGDGKTGDSTDANKTWQSCPADQSQVITTLDASGNVTVTAIQSLINANDNTYGTNSVGWGTKGHTFNDLVGSDHAEFIFKDKKGNVVLDFFLDYISQTKGSPATPSGYASLGVSGGDGKLISGNAAYITAYDTSLAKNLNTTGFCSGGVCTVSGVNLLVNSPPTTCTNNTVACYTLPASSPFGAWDFRNIYTVTISAQAFAAGGGFGSVEIGDLHNSPAKGLPSICVPPPPPAPAISLSKSPKGATFKAGDSLAFNMVVTSAGQVTATNVQLNDPLPTNGGLTWTVDAANTTFPGCSVNAGTQVLSCSGPLDLTPGASAKVAVKTTNAAGAPADACTGTPLKNVATATAAGGLSAQDSGDYNCATCPPDSNQVNTTVEASGDITVNLIQSLTNSNDNSYGTTAVGWGTKGHKFNDLTGSDKAEFIFKDKNGNVVLDFFLDYISAKTGTASGYGSLGVSGGDGKLVSGNAAFIKAFSSSLEKNLNTFCKAGNCTVAGTDLLVNSPPTICTNNAVACYGLAAGSPFGAWDFRNIYTVTIDKDAFGAAGFGSVEIGLVHNSPSKGTAPICGKGSGGDCDLDAAPLSFEKNRIKLTVTNNGNADAVLSQVILGWPSANGKLTKISFDKDVIYDTPDLPPPAVTITTAQLIADTKKRMVQAGGSDVITLEFEKSVDTNLMNYSGTFSFGPGCEVTFGPSAGACVLGYPFASANPRTSIDFNESGVLQWVDPAVAGPKDTVRLFATDEHAILLGVRGTGNTFPVSAMNANPGHVANPAIGNPKETDPSGRPIFPSLFITDVTGITDTSVGNAAYRAGDWQYNGTPIPPNDIFGTWKGAVRSGSSLVTDANPATKNGWSLGAGSDVPSVGFATLDNLDYGAEVRWNVSNLCVNGSGTGTACGGSATPLSSLSGHTFRLQFIVHDGDQNKTGGDVGQACALVAVP